MTGNTVQRRFGERERERLAKLFSQLGTDNKHEAEAARSRIEALLHQFGKTWADLIELLGGRTSNIRADLARDIIGLGSSNPGERIKARRNIADLLARHRKNWNDLVDVLCATSFEAWACNSSAEDDLPRANPLELVRYLFEEYVTMKPHEYIAAALWALHTHVYDRFMVTPRLALRSPVPGCGKTTLLDILYRLTARPKKFDFISTAVLYRLLDEAHPSLLIDEVDNLGLALVPNGRLRAVFNSGHRKGGSGTLMERGRRREFSLFAPLALALPDMFGGLPRTLNERSITITMERHDGQRQLKRFDAIQPDPALEVAYHQILLWRQEVELNSDPELPLRNRFADNWRPLISIADSLGWGEQARGALVIFAREYHDADVKILLLTDIRKAFDLRRVDYLPTKILLEALYEIDGAEWSEFCGVRGDRPPHKLKDTEFARMLRDFAIRPCTIWPPNRTPKSKSAKGYRRSQFEGAWRKYCADDGTTAQGSNIMSLRRAGDGTV